VRVCRCRGCCSLSLCVCVCDLLIFLHLLFTGRALERALARRLAHPCSICLYVSCVGPAVLCVGRLCGAVWPAFRGPLCGSLLRRLVSRFPSLFPATYLLCLSFAASAAVLSHTVHTCSSQAEPSSVLWRAGGWIHQKQNPSAAVLKQREPSPFSSTGYGVAEVWICIYRYRYVYIYRYR